MKSSIKSERVKDRFIMSRTEVDLHENFRNRVQTIEETEPAKGIEGTEPVPDNAPSLLYKALLQTQVLGQRCLLDPLDLLDENAEPISRRTSSSPYKRRTPFVIGEEPEIIYPYKEERHIPKTPVKVLDAPALQDDYYLDVVHWSKSNVLGVGLGKCVYLWTATNSKVTKVNEFDESDSVASLAWAEKSNYLAVGSNKGVLQIWDPNELKLLYSIKAHNGRIGTMSWSPSSNLLSTGSRDKTIAHRDMRCGVNTSQIVSKIVAHKQEVCGLRWSPDDQYLCSGGNDNKIHIWTKEKLSSQFLKFGEHIAAVKALAWSPHQHGLLGSGGGTADRCLRFWDINTGKPLNYVDTGSQVCNMIWGENVNEIITTHGYSQNLVTLWKYQPLKKIASLSGHLSRVLYIALSPDGQTAVTGSGDETLRFWQMFPPSAHDLLKPPKWAVLPSENNLR